MQQIIAVGVGGFLGAVSRFVLVRWIQSVLDHSLFPYGTLAVNVVGSFIMGALIAAMAAGWNTSQEMRVFLATGILGGFTTFSTFGVETVRAIESGHWGIVAANVGLNVVAGVALIGLAAVGRDVLIGYAVMAAQSTPDDVRNGTQVCHTASRTGRRLTPNLSASPRRLIFSPGSISAPRIFARSCLQISRAYR